MSDSSGSSSEEEEKALEASLDLPLEVLAMLLFSSEEDLGKRLQPLRMNADVSANPIIFRFCLFIVFGLIP